MTGSRRWWALMSLVPAALAVSLDATVLSVALPTLGTDLHASTDALQWFVIAYTLAFAAAMIPAGLLGDRVGRKRVLLTSLVVFGAGSLACATATGPATMIAARAILGIGAAAVLPMTMAFITVLFEETERSKALAVIMTVTMLGFPIGPIVGGWLVTNAWWGWVFLINLPVVAVAMVAVAALLPESSATSIAGTSVDRTARGPVDVAGIVLSSAALAALSYGVTEVGERGWGDVVAVGWVLAGVALGVGFVRRERRTAAPLVDLALFSSRSFSAGTAAAALTSFVMFGLLFAVPLYVQGVRGLDAQGVGLRLLPLVAGMVVTALPGQRLVPRLGARVVVGAGMVLLAAALALGATTTRTDGDALALTWVALAGAGLGLSLPTAMGAALGELDEAASGTGSAVIQALRMVGGSFGAAILGAILNAGYRAWLPTGSAPLTGLPGEATAAVRDGLSAAAEVAQALHAPEVLDAARSAFVSGMDTTLWVCAGLTLAGGLTAAAFLPGRHRPGHGEAAGSEHERIAAS